MILALLKEGESFLQNNNIENPRINSEFLLSKVLKTDRYSILLDSNRKITKDEVSEFRELISIRSKHIPLQHLLGAQQFRELELFVGQGVFIPRPETETLVSIALDIISSITLCEAKNLHSQSLCQQRISCLDIGTGTGAIPLAITTENPNTFFDAVEKSKEAINFTKKNLRAYPNVSKRINLIETDIFKFKTNKKYNLIITNPPYIPTSQIGFLPKEVSFGDPHIALDGGLDGLDFIKKVADLVKDWLLPGGWFLTEFGDGQGEELKSFFKDRGFEEVKTSKDLTGRDRFLGSVLK